MSAESAYNFFRVTSVAEPLNLGTIYTSESKLDFVVQTIDITIPDVHYTDLFHFQGSW